MSAEIRHLAYQLLDLGFCVMPPKEDGSKRPDGPWKDFQTRLPTREEVDSWYQRDRSGVGIIGGAVSRNLELLEFEGRAVHEGIKDAFLEAACKLDLSPLI